jgi:hypothetical protein
VQGYRDVIFQRYISYQGVDGITNRDLEVWTPIIIIAEILDSALPESSIRSQMVQLARRIIAQRRRRQLIENRDAQILEATRTFIEQTTPVTKDGRDFYVGEQLCDFIRDQWDILGLRTEHVSRALNSHNIIRDIQRLRLNIRENGSSKMIQKSCYQLDRERLTELTRDYF